MRLELGRLYALDGRRYRCTLVNDCRARLSPDWKESRSFLEPDGTERTVRFTPPGLDVSPNSVLEEWCP